MHNWVFIPAAAAASDFELHAVGGSMPDVTTYGNTHESYDGSSWTTETDHPGETRRTNARWGHGYDGKFWLLAGAREVDRHPYGWPSSDAYDGTVWTTPLSDLNVIDCASGEPIDSMSRANTSYIYLEVGHNSFTSTKEFYHADGTSWTRRADARERSYSGGQCVLYGEGSYETLHSIKGRDDYPGVSKNDHSSYNETGDAWTSRTNSPTYGRAPSCWASLENTYMYDMGGYDTDGSGGTMGLNTP